MWLVQMNSTDRKRPPESVLRISEPSPPGKYVEARGACGIRDGSEYQDWLDEARLELRFNLSESCVQTLNRISKGGKDTACGSCQELHLPHLAF